MGEPTDRPILHSAGCRRVVFVCRVGRRGQGERGDEAQNANLELRTATSGAASALDRDSLRNSVIPDDSQRGGAPSFPLLEGSPALAQAPVRVLNEGDAAPQEATQKFALTGAPRSPVLDESSVPEEFVLTSSAAVQAPVDKGAPELTPFMRQWAAAKHQNPDALVFFRMGDFYELFYDDAAVASRELQLTLTARDKERNIPMCGVPYHAVEQYVARLLRKGYRIALCDQMEDPKLTKKLVKREVTRVLTPGTALDAGLGQERNNFLAALWEGDGLRTVGPYSDPAHPSGKNKNAARVGHPDLGVGHQGLVCAVALLDVSTGEFRAMEFRGEHARAQAMDELLLAAPSEVLMAASAEAPALLERIPARTRVEDWVWTQEYAVPLVERQLNVRSLEGFGLNGHEAAAIAAGAVLHYVRSTQKNDAPHIDSLKFEEHSTALELDQVTVRNLELVEPLFSGQDDRATLFRTLDACLTPMGKRLLRATILRPLNNAPEIEARLRSGGRGAW